MSVKNLVFDKIFDLYYKMESMDLYLSFSVLIGFGQIMKKYMCIQYKLCMCAWLFGRRTVGSSVKATPVMKMFL